MILSISWKNIWRNKVRSLVVIVASTLGIISGVMVVGIMEGWVEQRLHDAIYNEVSHIQIHNSDYLKNEEINLTVQDTALVAEAVKQLPGLKGWVARTKMVVMANTPWANTGIFIYGIDPEREKQVSEIYKKIIPGAGNYLDKDKPGTILISDKTAEILKLKQYCLTDTVIGKLERGELPKSVLSKLAGIKDERFRSPKDFRAILKSLLTGKELDNYGRQVMDSSLEYKIRNKIQITLSDEKGTPVQGTFRVCGIYRTTNTGFDQVTAFVNAGELAALYDGKSILIHEIAIMIDDIENAGSAKEKLSGISRHNTVSTWKELAPDAAMMNDFMIIYYFIFIGIVMFALAFGIINTMMMTILERTRELGMLMAIGMNRRRIFSMIMLETIFLTVVGAAAGMVGGWVIVMSLGKTGIHFLSWGEGFEAIGFAATVYPVITPFFFIIITIMVISTAIISSVWPARKALKLDPAEAIRTE
ncbi:MAG: ABC transporter permease [Bacteroidales bacterium]|nr:ABC transporter permease [Bacteroidales bacterium]